MNYLELGDEVFLKGRVYGIKCNPPDTFPRLEYEVQLENGDVIDEIMSWVLLTSVPSTPEIEKVLYDTKQDRPVTVVFWKDGTKTWVKCAEGDVFSKWSGLALCYCKKMLCDNDTVKFHQMFKRWCE